MKITEVRINVGETVGLPSYSSAKIDAGVTITLEDGEDSTEAKRRAIAWCIDTVHKEVDRALIEVGQPEKYGKVKIVEPSQEEIQITQGELNANTNK